MLRAALGITREEYLGWDLSSSTAAEGTSSSKKPFGKGFEEDVEGEGGTALDLKSACSEHAEHDGKNEWKCDFHDNKGVGGAAWGGMRRWRGERRLRAAGGGGIVEKHLDFAMGAAGRASRR